MNILGFHGSLTREDENDPLGYAFHDAAAVLMCDGVLVAAIEEERLSRMKHASAFPFRAIQACLRQAGLSIDQIDRIGINVSQRSMRAHAIQNWLGDATKRGLPDACSGIADSFRGVFGVEVASRLTFCPHHLAHAWSAFVPSGYSESLILVVDGDAELLSGMVLVGRGRELTGVQEYPLAKSLGRLYTELISLIGYSRFDEYKAMGLAPYGDAAVYQALFERGCRLLPEGNYDIDPPEMWIPRLEQAGLIQGARRKGQPFTQAHKDFAAGLQAAIERIILHILCHYQRQTGQRRLCLAGGVAHNCSANGAVLASGLFEQVFVQPAAHDAGTAYGAAIHAAHQLGDESRETPWTHVYLGTDIGGCAEIRETLTRWHGFVEWEQMTNVAEESARLLEEGAVIGWAQGRSEFGPRALGNRSILADPRPAENKQRINMMVKKREAFRPFAPAVLAEAVSDYFEVPEHQLEFPFMIFVLKVKPEARARLGAVTHVDGTARVQTVSKETNSRFWSVIQEFGRRTGIPILLNTSFNNNAEPIVESADDAICCFLTTQLDYVVIGDFIVRKKQVQMPASWYGQLALDVPPARQLVKRRQLCQQTGAFHDVFALASTRSRFFGPPLVSISESMYHALRLSDGQRPLAELASQSDLRGARLDDLCGEAALLWRDRVISARPPS